MKKDLFAFSVQFAAGGVVTLLALYGAGLFIPSNQANQQTAAALINFQANLCQQQAVAYLAEAGDTTPLNGEGMDARAWRDELATRSFVASGDKTMDRLIREACSAKLAA